VDFSEYFDDIVGVTRYADDRAQLIRLRFTPQRYNYVVTKPIHGLTQRNYDDRYEITIEVRPNRELEALILSYGGDVEVLEPLELRNRIAEKIQNMYSIYSPK
jgi:predicted DNA-binding transcriptional regulator YafY